MRDSVCLPVRLLTGRRGATYLLHIYCHFLRLSSHKHTSKRPLLAVSVLLTCFPHLVFAVSQQFKDVHLQLARGRAVGVSVDAFFGQRDGQTLPSAALHGVIKDGRWEEGRRERAEGRKMRRKNRPCFFLMNENWGHLCGQWSFHLRSCDNSFNAPPLFDLH